MKVLLRLLLLSALTGCTWFDKPTRLPIEQPTRVFPGLNDVRDSVLLPLERGAAPPPGYGLYTTVLVRSANRNALKLLSELLATTSQAGDAALARENLNLIAIPVKSAVEATQALAPARESPGPTAGALMGKHYDYGQANLLLAQVCRPERGPALMKACGSTAPEGPILVTSYRPFDSTSGPSQRLLVVNLGNASPAAVAEIVTAYRRQIMRKDFADRAEIDGWRLAVLNLTLDAAQLLPGISKAYAAGK